MGLRIIDRPRPMPLESIHDEDVVKALAEAARSWTIFSQDELSEFIDHFKEVKSKLGGPESIHTTAEGISKNMASARGNFASAHGDIDLTTLLELLDNN